MSARPERAAFYAVGRGRLGDVLTVLHPPYTAWHLSYFVIGAALAPHLHVDRLLWGLAAFGLAVGVAAHALDELHDRPLGTRLSARSLKAAAAVSLGGALAIGVAGVLVVSPWLAPLVLAGGLFLPAYNLELAGGRFHSDLWFAVGWGAFPAFTGYFVNSLRVTVASLLIAAGCMAMSVAQRRLSSAARELRRRTVAVSGVRDAATTAAPSRSRSTGLLAPLDGALAALSLTIVLARRRRCWRRDCEPGSARQQVGAGSRAHLQGAARRGQLGGLSRPSTAPPKPPPISAGAGGAGLEQPRDRRLHRRGGDLVEVAQARVGGVQQLAQGEGISARGRR